MGKIINLDFFLRDDVVEISKDLIGKELCTNFENCLTSGIIIETEAYAGINDKASHAYNNRKTNRTKTMFLKGGVAYVYLCYGIHHLFNIVTNVEGIPHAVLIRAIVPKQGIDTMLKRRNKLKPSIKISGGPGTTSQALGIKTQHDGINLLKDKIWLEGGIKIKPNQIISSKRIGIDYAEEDAKLLYRFTINPSLVKDKIDNYS